MPSTSGPRDYAYPPDATNDEVRDVIGKACASAAHPRLLAVADTFEILRQRAAAGGAHGMLAEVLVAQADHLCDVAPIQRIQEGRRLLGQSHKCVKRTSTLAMAFRLTGERRYATRCGEEMLAIAGFADWNPEHYLDVAEMTFGMAIGYDWLYDALDGPARRTIREGILDKGVRLPERTEYSGWVTARNNWGQVCHGGMVAGALAALEHEPELAVATVARALRNVTIAMDAYAPNGGYPEGPGYWSYGTAYNVLLIDMLEKALGSDFGLLKAPGFDQTGAFVDIATGPSGEFFNFADGGSKRALQPALFWLARRFQRPDWLQREHEALLTLCRKTRAEEAGGNRDRFLAFLPLWLDGGQTTGEIRMPLHWESKGRVPVTVHRSSWTDPRATYVGLKGGSPSADHGQMDTGSFVLDADGVRWGIDLGAEPYHGIEARGMDLWGKAQDSERWTILRQSNAGHNTLVIDGRLQAVDGYGDIVKFSGHPGFPCSVVDLSDVYAEQVDEAQRGVALLPSGEVLIRDHITGLEPGATVRWGMITRAAPDFHGRDAVLTQGGARLTLTALAASGATWGTFDTAVPANEWDSPNEGTVMVTLKARAPASGAVDFAVLATPGSCRQSMIEKVPLTPPAEW